MKISPLGTELFHADRRTDMTELIVAVRIFFSDAPKNVTDLNQTNEQPMLLLVFVLTISPETGLSKTAKKIEEILVEHHYA